MSTSLRIYAHRVNTIEKLGRTPTHFGVEIDLRGVYDTLYLNHDPLKSGEEYLEFEAFLQAYKERGLTGGIIFNMKEMGYEKYVLELAAKYDIDMTRSFLLDEEFPYIYRAGRKEGMRNLAIRYSEAEPIEMVEAQVDASGKPLADWVWIDTNTRLPLTAEVVGRLKDWQTCLVCPERWGRPQDIAGYAAQMKALNFTPTAVMTSLECAPEWESLYS